ncbi:MAG: hypothetical protein LBP72_09900 [Dysgonamonadaceae bacterium]|nr:hypothetical protein [Dysgonamonadaceae bacterium]
MLFAGIPVVLYAQNSTESPYSRYGYGKLSDRALGAQRGMGGIGYGLRNSQTINTLNPAAFSSVDSMTFMMDFGVMAQSAWYEEKQSKSRKSHANLEYVALQFPLSQTLGMGLGFEPFSSVGYNYGRVDSLKQVGGWAQEIYKGTGGFSKVYTSLSYKISPRLSAGINVGYLFGNIINNRQMIPLSGGDYSVRPDTLQTSSFVYEAGVQYVLPAGKNKYWVFGAVFSPPIKLNNTFSKSEFNVNQSGLIQGNSNYYSTKDSVFELPATYGLGVTFNEKDKFTAGIDVQYQAWASAKYYDKTGDLSNRLKINLGGEYIPDSRSNHFLKRIRYRAGLNYSNSYINVSGSGKGYKEYSAGLGLGIPMLDRRSFVNLAFDYTLLNPDAKSYGVFDFVNERYFRLTVSYTFNELWFFKRKVQ